MVVCHSVSTARRKASSFAAVSSGVSQRRSRSASSCATSISRSIVLLRLTSVGWAVSTGQTTARVKKFCSLEREMSASRARASAWAMVPSRCRSGQRVGSCPADVMLVFGDVGELRKVAESADDLDVLSMREAIQRRFVFFAVEADRGPADVLDDPEDRLAFLAAHRIAKNAAEQTDIVTQRQILVGSFERIHDHTNSNDAAAEAASNSTTAIGAEFSRRSRASTILAVLRQTDQPAECVPRTDWA